MSDAHDPPPPRGLDTDAPARVDAPTAGQASQAFVQSQDTGAAALDAALRLLGYTVDSQSPLQLDRRGHVVTPGVTADVMQRMAGSSDRTPGELERLRETMTGLDRASDGIAITKNVATHVDPGKLTSLSGRDVVRGAVLEGFDAIAVDASAHGTRLALEKSGNPVIASGSNLVGAVDTPGWVAVTAFDEKTHSFTVLDAHQPKPQQWDAKTLDAYMHGQSGGNAIEIAARPAQALNQSQIDAIVAATPAEMRATARWTAPLIANECARAHVTDSGQVAYILATAAHESHMGDWMHEGDYLSKPAVGYFEKQYRGVNGNREDVLRDGFDYRGTGFIQVTGRGTFGEISDKLGFSPVLQDGARVPAAVAHPDLLARPDVAARSLVVGLRDGWYGNRDPLSHYVSGRTKDFYDARGAVNGDKTHFDDAHPGESIGHRIADQARAYDRAIEREPLQHVQSAIDRADLGAPRIPNAVTVSPWDGKPHSGTLLRVDDSTFAIHVGRGSYQTLDLHRDLGNVEPAVGRNAAIDARGIVTTPPLVHEPLAR